MAALVFPLKMPTTGVNHTDFELVFNDTINDLPGGTYATEIAQPYWDITITTTITSRTSTRYRIWRAFIDALRGSKKIGLFYDADAPRPSDYVASGLPGTAFGGGAFTGVAAIDTITDQHNVTISGLPALLQLRQSDYVEFIHASGSRHFLCRLIQDVKANSSGIASINFEPELPLLFTESDTVNLEKPSTEGFLQANSISAARDIEGSPLTLKARSRMF